MKRNSKIVIYLISIFAVGIFSLINAGLSNSVPVSDLSQKFTQIFRVGLGLMALTSLLSMAGVVVLIRKNQLDESSLQERIALRLSKRWIRSGSILFLSLISLVAAQMLFQIPGADNDLVKSILILNRPFLSWLIGVSLISLLLIASMLNVVTLLKKPDVLIPILIFLFLTLVLIGIDISNFGFGNRQNGGGNFRLTGFPVLDYQVLIIWFSTFVGLLITYWFGRIWLKDKKISPLLVDIAIGAAIFLIAFLVWQGAPIIPNAFIDQPRPPNFQYFPNLDAVIYDRTALSLLATGKLQTYIGTGDALWIGRRPLLAVFLAGLHWLSGGDYSQLILIQLGFFALMPVLVYLFTRTLHNRFSGVLTAGIIIVRNLNGVWLQEDVWGGTSLQMLMSDIPAMMFVVLFLYLILLWIKKPGRGFTFPLICGAVLGLGMLIRQELVVMLPVVGLVGFLIYRKKFGWLVGQLSLMLVGLVIVITPWMTRNYLATGKLYLDKPGKAIDRITETISFLSYKSTETGQDISELETDPDPGETQDILETTPAFTAMANHYANAIPQVFLYLPSNPVFLEVDYLWRLANRDLERNYGGIAYSPYSYAKSLPYWWWDQWDGKIDPKSWLPLGVNLLLISAGIYKVWKKGRWSVFLPILALVAMITSYVIIRGSGGRWLQSVDWVSAMFLSIGLVPITKATLPFLPGEEEEMPEGQDSSGDSEKVWGWVVLLALLLVGSSPVIAEISLPNQYPTSARGERLDDLLDRENSPLSAAEVELVEEFLDQGGEVLYGRALYPRYFPPDTALMTLNQSLFTSSTTFTIAGPELNFVVLPMLEPPAWFPQGAETLVIGCRESSLAPGPGFPCLGCYTGEFEAVVVLLFDYNETLKDVLWKDNIQSQSSLCP